MDSADPTEWVRSERALSISLPTSQGWEVRANEVGVRVVLINLHGRRMIWIDFQSVDAGATLPNDLEAIMRQWTKDRGVEVTSSNRVTIDGVPAYRIETQKRIGEAVERDLFIVAVTNSTIYRFTIICQCEDLASDPDIATTISSIDFAPFRKPNENDYQLRSHQRAGTSQDEISPSRITRYRSKCDQGSMRDCHNLAVLLDNGSGSTPDQKRAFNLFQRACQSGLKPSCAALGPYYMDGVVVEQDQVKAVSLYDDGCREGVLQACTNLGIAYAKGTGVQSDSARSATLLKKSCHNGDMAGCFNLAYAYELGRGVPENATLAESLYRQACDAGLAVACHNLGVWHGSSASDARRDPKRSAAYYKRACDSGFSESCCELGYAYAGGIGVSRDIGLAREVTSKGCDGGVALCCYNLGTMYENGTGVLKQLSRAKLLYDKACEGGHRHGCLASSRIERQRK